MLWCAQGVIRVNRKWFLIEKVIYYIIFADKNEAYFYLKFIAF